MSASWPNASRKHEMIREKILTGQVDEDMGISSSFIMVEKMTLKPERKYS
jgi:hypothetical protein